MPRPSALTDPRGPVYPDRVGHGLKPGSPEWMEWVHEVDARKGYIVCGRSNRFDEPCELKSPINKHPGVGVHPGGYDRPPCVHQHSGRSGLGIANQNYKHGNRTKSTRYNLTGKLAGVNDRLADMDYLSLREDIATIEEMTAQALAVLDDETPCPEPWPEPPLDPKVHGKAAADERGAAIFTREIEIENWCAVRRQATARYDELVKTRALLSRVEQNRVKLSADTLSGQMVRQIGSVMLQIARRRFLSLGEQYGIPLEEVLRELAEYQEEVVSAIQNARGHAPGTGRVQ
jgi:hypothetical protein